MNLVRCGRRWVGTAVLLTLTGCLGYHLGPVGEIDYRKVAVPMFRNDTVQPQLEAQVTNGIIKRLQHDGSLQIVDRAEADVVVVGVITRYKRTMLRSEREETGVPREYRVIITAEVEVFDQRKLKPAIPKTELTGAADVFIGSDLQSADYQALPLAAEDLARKVATLLAERWPK